MKNIFYLFLFIVIFPNLIFASDGVVIPKSNNKLPVYISDSSIPSESFNTTQKPNYKSDIDTRALTSLINDFTYSSVDKNREGELSIELRKSVKERLAPRDSRHSSYAKIYAGPNTESYALSQSNLNLSGSVLDALATGVSVGYDSYLERGVIDISYGARYGFLYLGSRYVGSVVAFYANKALIEPIVTSTLSGSLGAGAASIFGDIAGGVTVGSLFAIGAYATGSVDRHTARLLIAKSAAGSTAAASVLLILGTSTVTTGVFSFGTLIIPYLTVFATYYAVDKIFAAMDKIEEGERIEAVANALK